MPRERIMYAPPTFFANIGRRGARGLAQEPGYWAGNEIKVRVTEIEPESSPSRYQLLQLWPRNDTSPVIVFDTQEKRQVFTTPWNPSPEALAEAERRADRLNAEHEAPSKPRYTVLEPSNGGDSVWVLDQKYKTLVREFRKEDYGDALAAAHSHAASLNSIGAYAWGT